MRSWGEVWVGMILWANLRAGYPDQKIVDDILTGFD
jgi:hypothetical protein